MSVNAEVLALAQVMGLGYGVLSMVGLLLEITVESRPRGSALKREVSFDWPGSLLSILGGIAVLFFGFEQLGDDAGNSPGFWLIPTGLVLLTLFAVVERKVRTPLLDLNLFRSRMFFFGSSAAGIYFIAAVSCYFMMPFYLQLAMGYPPLKAGMDTPYGFWPKLYVQRDDSSVMISRTVLISAKKSFMICNDISCTRGSKEVVASEITVD